MNLMTLGEEEAQALGVDTRRTRFAIVSGATLMTAAAVSVSGIIGWIGLLIPHFARLLVGPDFGRLLPAAMLLGAGYLLAVDTLARTIANIEVPLGVLTAFIGTPFSSGCSSLRAGAGTKKQPRCASKSIILRLGTMEDRSEAK
jgi:iron complex transport system permease protein